MSCGDHQSFQSPRSYDSYVAKSETLDYLYGEQLEQVREWIHKRGEFQQIDLVRKWLKVFNKTSKSEKLARNCLCTLMQSQLRQWGQLDSPFTDLKNVNRDLEFVLEQIDGEMSLSERTTHSNIEGMTQMPTPTPTPAPTQQPKLTKPVGAEHANRAATKSVFIPTTVGPPIEIPVLACHSPNNSFSLDSPAQSTPPSAGSKASDSISSTVSTQTIRLSQNQTAPNQNMSNGVYNDEDENEFINRKFCELRAELDVLRLSLRKHHDENRELRKFIEQCFQVHEIKLIMRGCMDHTLECVQQNFQQNEPLKVFESMFITFEPDEKFYHYALECDKELNNIITKMMKRAVLKLKDHVAQDAKERIKKCKEKFRKKLEERVEIQGWGFDIELKLVKLKCFSTLRKIFVDICTKKGLTEDLENLMLHILQELEMEYEKTMDEIV